MNYLGHAAVALEVEESPGFVLGAMLPDLLGMLRLRVPSVLPDDVTRGVRFHERTDAAFHDTRVFVESNRAAVKALGELGVRRGPARAMAHMGVEMVIDGALVREPRISSGYLRALAEGATELDADFDAPLRAELLDLLDRLVTGGANVHARTHERLAFRFERSLSGRRLLEPTSDETHIAAAYFVDVSPALDERLPQLWRELREALSIRATMNEDDVR